MPKDPAKNVDRYKIRGGVINEYEYHENQQALAQNEPKGDGRLIPGTLPEQQFENNAAKKSQPQKSTKSTKTKEAATRTKEAATKTAATKKAATRSTKYTLRGASAKKLAARRAAKKSF